MAGIMLRSSLSMFKVSQKSVPILHHAQVLTYLQVNHIFGPSYLKTELFTKMRTQIDTQFGPAKDKFFERIREQVTDGGKGDQIVFTEDVKNAVYLVQNSPEDMELLEKMLRKFSSQNAEQRFGSFQFGPLIMRLLYVLNQPDLALKLIKDESLDSFLSSINTFLLVMHLLYKNQRYVEVMDVFDLIGKRECLTVKYPLDCVTQFTAAAWKLNTPESYERAKKLITDIRAAGGRPQLRANNFMASLALSQNHPDVAYELMSNVERPRAAERSLKIIAASQLDRPEEAIAILRAIAAVTGTRVEPKIHEEAIDPVQQAVNRKNDGNLTAEFDRVREELSQKNLLLATPINDYLEREIDRRPFSQEERINKRIGLGRGPPRGLNMPNQYERGRDVDNRGYENRGYENRGFDRGNRDQPRQGGIRNTRGQPRYSTGFTSQRQGIMDDADGDEEYRRDRRRFSARGPTDD